MDTQAVGTILWGVLLAASTWITAAATRWSARGRRLARDLAAAQLVIEDLTAWRHRATLTAAQSGVVLPDLPKRVTDYLEETEP